MTLGQINEMPPPGIAAYPLANLEQSAFDRLWDFLQKQSSQSLPLQGILYLWSLETDAAQSLSCQVNSHCQTLLCLMQTLVQQTFSQLPKLWVVTQGAVVIGGTLEATHPPALSLAPMWGFSRGFGLEYPRLWGGLIDLEQGVPIAQQVPAIAAELVEQQGEDQIAYRQGKRHVARLVKRLPIPLADVRPINIQT
ncbi:MAG: hypothetical protein HC767_00920, partial [Akkermansiaceae bacterium]|nr:hypothetical protein [Akkermansiaceae bacterium]